MTDENALDASIESYDPELAARVYCTPEQQALRFGVALLLAIYACFLPGLLPTPGWLFVAAPALYAIAQAVLGLYEERHGASHRISGAVSALDIVLMAPALWFDPLASTPTVLLLGLFFGLGSLRHRQHTLAKMTLGMLILSAVILVLRALNQPQLSVLALLATLAVLLLLMGLVVMFRHHSIDLRASADLAPHDDPETGLASRTTLYAAARLLWPLAHRQNMPVSLLYAVLEPENTSTPGAMADARQSRILAQTFAAVAQAQLRGSDILVRYDRLRFVFVLLDCPHAQADSVVERLQAAFAERLMSTTFTAQLHMSATWLPTLPLALDPMLSALHSALDRARLRGRAQVGAVHIDPEQLRD